MFADEAAVSAAFEAWLRRMPAGATLVANVGDPGAGAVVDRLRDAPARGRSPTPWSTTRRSAVGTCAASATATDRRRPGDRRPGPDRRRRTATGTTVEVYGLDELAGAASPSGCRPPAGTTRRTPWRSPGRPLPSACRHGDRGRPRAPSTASDVGSSSRATSAGVVVYDDYGHHPTAIARPSPPSASAIPAGGSGPSTSR